MEKSTEANMSKKNEISPTEGYREEEGGPLTPNFLIREMIKRGLWKRNLADLHIRRPALSSGGAETLCSANWLVEIESHVESRGG